ncbi:hypothetical protein ACQPW3_08190 [Actinosynnema sp. CA-248983]
MWDEGEQDMPSVATILNTLFERHRKETRPGSKRPGRPFSNQEVAEWCTLHGVEMSQTHLWNLRQESKSVDPRVGHLKILARFFGYRPAYFLDPGVYWETEAQYGNPRPGSADDLSIPRQAAQAHVLMRRVDGLSDAGRELMLGLVEQVVEWERNHVSDGRDA